MASTIILKNGTGSAIPSALAHGEPAINVDTGLFYYGSGSVGAVKTFSNFTDITASLSASLGGNISASGTITAEHIVSSDDIVASGELFTNGTGLNKIAGILTLGSSTIPTGGNNLKVTGTSTFTSHITASGNISASGTSHILGGDLTIDDLHLGEGRHNIDSHGSNTLTISSGSTALVQFAPAGGAQFTSHITASGNISASGTISTTGNVSASGNMVAGGFISSSGRIQTLSHITASGNISSSGIIQGKINSSDTSVDAIHYPMIQTAEDTVPFITNGYTFNPSTDIFIFGSDKVTVDGVRGNITASGIISASGTGLHTLGGPLTLHKTADSIFTIMGNIENKVEHELHGRGNIHSFLCSSSTMNLGIGNSTPPEKLTVSGSISASGDLILEGGISSSIYIKTTHITASGNISASGFLSSSKIHSIGDTSATFFNARTGTTGYKLGGVKIIYKSGSGDIIFGQTNKKTIITGSSVVLGNHAAAHITSSGNISSSGTITADTFKIQGKTAITYSEPQMTFGQTNKKSLFRGDTILIGATADQHVTASGNISASGDIYSSNHEVLAGSSFKVVDLDDGYYGLPGNNGWSNITYGFQFTNGADGLGNTSQHVGIVMPYKAILVGVIGQFRASATGDYKMSLWTDKVEDGNGSSATDWAETILTGAVTVDTINRPYNFEKLDGTTAFVKGTSIIPGFFNNSGTDTVDIFGSFMVIVQRVV